MPTTIGARDYIVVGLSVVDMPDTKTVVVTEETHQRLKNALHDLRVDTFEDVIEHFLDGHEAKAKKGGKA
jgi:hypothetical protein